MAKLTDEEAKLLKDLTDKANEEDPDEKFEIEIYDTSQGKGARVPYSHGKKWLFDTFGLGTNPDPATDEDGKDGKKDEGKVRTGYFGRQQNQGKAS